MIIFFLPSIIVGIAVIWILWRNYTPIDNKRNRADISLKPTSFGDERWRKHNELKRGVV